LAEVTGEGGIAIAELTNFLIYPDEGILPQGFSLPIESLPQLFKLGDELEVAFLGPFLQGSGEVGQDLWGGQGGNLLSQTA
jgi:hypothetical protein